MYKLLLIWRFFLHKRVALIAVAAVALLVMMVLVVLSVMSGLVNEARGRNHRWVGDVVVGRDSLVGFDGYEDFIGRLGECEVVAGATPVIQTYGLVEQDSSRMLMGVRLAEFCEVTGFSETLCLQADKEKLHLTLPKRGYAWPKKSLQELSDEQRRRGCIGWTPATSWERMENLLWQGGEVMWLLPNDVTVFGLNSRGMLAGSEAGQRQRFWYMGSFETRLVDVDRHLLIVDFDELQKLCWMDGADGKGKRASEIRIKLKDGVGLETGRAAVAGLWKRFATEKAERGEGRLVADVRVQSWEQYRRSNIAPLEREKVMLTLVFCLIGMVAVAIVFAIFYMIVTEKIKDLAIVKSIGGSSWGLANIFVGYGMLVGAVGAVAGTVAGVLIVTNSNSIEDQLYEWFEFRLWPPDVYMIDKMPDVVDSGQAVVIAVVAVMAAVLGAALPARRAGRLEVVEALRVE